MNKIVLKNWLITTNQDGFTPPELVENYLHGNVYGHPKFNDGDPVNTSAIRGITDCGTYKIVKTRNTEYTVYPEDVNSEYEEKFPDSFKRLSVKTNDATSTSFADFIKTNYEKIKAITPLNPTISKEDE